MNKSVLATAVIISIVISLALYGIGGIGITVVQNKNCDNLIEIQRVAVNDNTNPEALEDSWIYFERYWNLEDYQCEQFYDLDEIKKKIKGAN